MNHLLTQDSSWGCKNASWRENSSCWRCGEICPWYHNSSEEALQRDRTEELQASSTGIRNAVVNSIMSRNSHRTVTEALGASISEISCLIQKTSNELDTRTKSGRRGERHVKVTPDVAEDLTDVVTTHPQCMMKEMLLDWVKGEALPFWCQAYLPCWRASRQHTETLQRATRRKLEGFSWHGYRVGLSFNGWRDLGCQCLFVDESGFNMSLGRERNIQELGRHQMLTPTRGQMRQVQLWWSWGWSCSWRCAGVWLQKDLWSSKNNGARIREAHRVGSWWYLWIMQGCTKGLGWEHWHPRDNSQVGLSTYPPYPVAHSWMPPRWCLLKQGVVLSQSLCSTQKEGRIEGSEWQGNKENGWGKHRGLLFSSGHNSHQLFGELLLSQTHSRKWSDDLRTMLGIYTNKE